MQHFHSIIFPDLKQLNWNSITEIRLIILFAAKDGEALHGQQKTRPGADCGSEHELLITKFRLKLKKVGKTIRPFRSRPKSNTL